MDKLVEIKLTKCVLYLEESELIKLIPPDLFIKALKTGKAIKRTQSFKERLKKELKA